MSETIDAIQLQNLSKDELIVLIVKQGEQIMALTQQVKALQEQLAKNSHNSHKPPSSDGLKKSRTKSLREKGKRKTGGQMGHVGKTLCQVEQPNQIVVHGLGSCPHCEQDLQGIEVQGVEKRQVFDLPVIQVEVTEHQAEIKLCPCCGKRVKADFPVAVAQTVQYGPQLKGQIAYLSVYQLLPLSRLLELLRDCYGVGASEGMVLATLAEMEQEVQPTLEAIRQQLPQSRVVHADETGLRVAGCLRWMHVLSSERVTYYAVHAKRGQLALHAIGLVGRCQGWLMHDAYASYFAFQPLRHALCNAHLLRELTFLAEEQGQAWAEDLKRLLLEIKSRMQVLGEGEGLAEEQIEHFQARYTILVQQGWQHNPLPAPMGKKPRGRMKKTDAQNLLQRLEHHREAVLAFMEHEGVPFDNNLAERDLRMVKVRQKISGCFRTERGAQLFASLRSYISTVRKQGCKLLETLTATFAGQPFIPSLFPQA